MQRCAGERLRRGGASGGPIGRHEARRTEGQRAEESKSHTNSAHLPKLLSQSARGGTTL